MGSGSRSRAKCERDEDDTLSRGSEVARIPEKSGTTRANVYVSWETEAWYGLWQARNASSWEPLAARLNRFTREYVFVGRNLPFVRRFRDLIMLEDAN